MRHLLVPIISFFFLASAAGQAAGAKAMAGKEIYASACAACHGMDGKGVPKSRVGFDQPLPDFTDCSFATREPDSDWNAVTRHGGPARAFSELMPAFGDALSDEQIQMATAHVRTFCRDKNWPPGELNLPRPLVTEKAYPEDEAVFTSAIATGSVGGVLNRITYEKRFGARNQFELVLPFGWREQGPPNLTTPENWRGGVGDIALAAKRALFHSGRTGSIFSATGEVVLPTGDRNKGFGTGTTIFETFVTYGQILPSEFFFQGQTGFVIPVDKDRENREGFWRLNFGRTFTAGRYGRAWSPMVELLGSKALVRGERVVWDVVPQMQVTLSRRQHIMMNVGLRMPVTEIGPRATQIMVYFLWDWFDGGLFEGW